jgi:integrase/recombinase XerD
MYLYNSYKDTRGRPVTLDTQNAKLVTVRVFFQFLAKKGYFLYDPTSAITLPKRKVTLPKGVMTRQEIEKVLKQPNPDTPLGLRDKAILEVLYSSGVRNTELRQLTIYDADTINQELKINIGKGKKDRVVPVGQIACKYIDEYLKNSRPKILEYAKDVLKRNADETNVLFLSKGGKMITAANLIAMTKKYIRRAKVEKHITPHSFRHTCATHMLKGHASLRHIQELLGHSSVATTQIYTQVEVTDLKKEHKRCHPRENPK